MRVGDRVLVPILGKMHAARVVDPMTPLGCVEVDLIVPIYDDRLAPVALSRFVRASTDVYPMWFDEAKLPPITGVPLAVNAAGEIVTLDSDRARAICRVMQVPDAVIGIPTARWRRFVQRFTRRATQKARRQ